MDMNMPNNCSGGMSMSMTFHFGFMDTVLIEGWKAQNAGEFFAICLLFYLMAALYEGLKYFRERLNRIAIEKRCDRKYKKSNDVTLAITTDNQSFLFKELQTSMKCIEDEKEKLIKDKEKRGALSFLTHINGKEILLHLVQTMLHMIQVAMGYVLMLVVMTYNVWLGLAVVLGAGLGYLVVGRLRTIEGVKGMEHDDHCN